jgi:hypothetical protein
MIKPPPPQENLDQENRARRAQPPVLPVRVHRGRKGERRSMSEADYAQLVTAAHTSSPPQ